MQVILFVIITIISIVPIPLTDIPQGAELTFLYNPAVSWESHRLFYTSEDASNANVFSTNNIIALLSK